MPPQNDSPGADVVTAPALQKVTVGELPLQLWADIKIIAIRKNRPAQGIVEEALTEYRDREIKAVDKHTRAAR